MIHRKIQFCMPALQLYCFSFLMNYGKWRRASLLIISKVSRFNGKLWLRRQWQLDEWLAELHCKLLLLIKTPQRCFPRCMNKKKRKREKNSDHRQQTLTTTKTMTILVNEGKESKKSKTLPNIAVFFGSFWLLFRHTEAAWAFRIPHLKLISNNRHPPWYHQFLVFPCNLSISKLLWVFFGSASSKKPLCHDFTSCWVSWCITFFLPAALKYIPLDRHIRCSIRNCHIWFLASRLIKLFVLISSVFQKNLWNEMLITRLADPTTVWLGLTEFFHNNNNNTEINLGTTW